MYKVTARFPDDEKYGVTSQLRRAAAAIPTNIAEGYGRTGDRELARFLSIAAGSTNEVEYLLLLARDLDYLPRATQLSLTADLTQVRRMIASLTKRLAR